MPGEIKNIKTESQETAEKTENRETAEKAGNRETAEKTQGQTTGQKPEEAQTGTVASAGEPQARKSDKKTKRRNRRKKYLKWMILLILLLAAGTVVFLRMKAAKAEAQEPQVDSKNIGTVMRGDVTSELTSSGSLSPKDTYTITSLVEGEIIEADFEEGDQVEKGQVLYRIDPSDMDREIENAEKNLGYAKDDLAEAQADYQKALSELKGGTWCAPESGYIQELTLQAGDSVGQNTELGTLYNDTTMKLRLPFLSIDADAIQVGSQLLVTLSDTGEQIPGQVIEKSSMTETLTGGTMVKYITLIVSNPGGISTTDTATAQTGEIYSVASGTFEAYQSKPLRYDLDANVKVASVLVHEGDYVTAGTPIFTMTADSYQDALKQYENAVDQAEQSLDQAENSLEQQQENLEDYTITAPISGQVISKTGKVGDKITRGSDSGSNTLAIIYDLSELTFEMSIDELDISDVEVGQEVEVAADAFEDQTYSGHVTNVSLNGSYSNGVTTYPVTVTMDEIDNLLPSMNVDGTIILERAEDVLYIPSNALQRGNVVYVRDTSLTEEQKAEGSGENAGGPAGAAPAGEMPEPPAAPEGAAAENGPEGDGEAQAGGSQPRMPRQSDVPEGFTAVRVETGLVSDDYVEIVSGLSEGQEIYVSDSTDSGTGMMFGMTFGPGGGGPGGGGPGDGGPRR